ncbi:hypothetical protein ACQUQU_02740 [Thalassolituus sp. LLYu03]|uniref:hypothetical protein n=1 Tax=Thalassolituus sp. LLYu03 TaxID=3421656 RepID=UPI003D2B25DE
MSFFKKAAAPLCLSVSLPALVHATDSANAFNPSIGVILNGAMSHFSQNPDEYALPGFALGGESEPGAQGFSLGESELSLSANIDPDWYGTVILAFGEETEVENAYVQTSPASGVTVRAGRFFSGIGYMNEQHAHAWDFYDASLAYRALLGSQLRDDGVQVRWLAPTELFTEVGAEWFNGSSFPAGGSASKGQGAWSVFVHTGGDIGVSNSWRAGLSYLNANADERESGDEDDPDLFSGSAKVAVADFVWKWAPNGNDYAEAFKLQGEYLISKNDGEFTPAGGSALDYDASPSGWYLQGIYKFSPLWRAGVRYDRLSADQRDAAFDGTVLASGNSDPQRSSVMVDYSNSEFSRIRVQYNRDESSDVVDHQVFVQYTMSLGAHGAHSF